MLRLCLHVLPFENIFQQIQCYQKCARRHARIDVVCTRVVCMYESNMLDVNACLHIDTMYLNCNDMSSHKTSTEQ